MTDETGTSTYSYDPFGELISTTNGQGQTTSYTYDSSANQTSITYPLPTTTNTWVTSPVISYGYDNAGNITDVSDFTGKATTTSYNKDGLPVITSFQQSSANPTTNISPSITNTYDQADEISSINVSNATGSIYGFSYLRSPSGAIATQTNTGASSSSSGSSSTYLYDPLSRVTQMTTNSSSSTTRTTSSYSYDPSSNLITLPNGASATYDPAGELTSSVLPGTNGSSSTYTYNANGERTSSSISTPRSSTPQIITSATWNASNELTSYTTPYVSMTFATYNGEGLRTSATFSTSSGITTREHYLYNQTSSIPNIITDSTNAYIYNSSMVPFEQINLTTGITTYLITDATGSVRAVMSASAKIEATTNYDAYGNTTTKGGLSSYTPFGFSGSYSDPTGLTYLINRYYEPSTGQFISVDPLVIQTAQPYAYTGGDPVNLSDPSGMCNPNKSSNKWICVATNSLYQDSDPTLEVYKPFYNAVRQGTDPIQSMALLWYGVYQHNDTITQWTQQNLLDKLNTLAALHEEETQSGDTSPPPACTIPSGYSSTAYAASFECNVFATLALFSSESPGEYTMGAVPFFAGAVGEQSLAWFAFNSDSSTYYWESLAVQALQEFDSHELRNTPDGYFEFPFENLIDPSAPSTVKPFYGQPGGGIEITTESPIDVSGFPFQLFELPGAQP
jgi:RHS repeat-associated protein